MIAYFDWARLIVTLASLVASGWLLVDIYSFYELGSAIQSLIGSGHWEADDVTRRGALLLGLTGLGAACGVGIATLEIQWLIDERRRLRLKMLT
jgi:hypothetical protein